MKWTEMQEKAVIYPVKDILVAAAAGSGKTQVLTGRILNRITKDKADISKMLVITFTNAAAAEMRGRISKKIADAVAENPKNRHLRRQLAMVGSSDISTIHSFCLNVLKSYFYIPDIDPSFKIAEVYDINIMKAEALSEAMDYFYEAKDPDFLSAVDLLCGSKNDSALSDMAERIWLFATNDPFPEEWLESAKERYLSIDENFGFYADILMEKSVFMLNNAKEAISACVEFIRSYPEYDSKADAFLEDEEFLCSALSKELTWDEILSISTHGLKCNMRKFSRADEEFKKKLQYLMEKAKKSFSKIKEYIDIPLDDAIEYSKSMKASVSAIVETAKKAMEIYALKKSEKNVLDFGDLEHLTIKILTDKDDNGNIIPSEVAKEIRDKYTDIFVDEYQDVNDIQETILKMISGESKGQPNIFMVGDMKQSIYKFRMTNPKKIFGEKSDTFTPVSEATDKDDHIKIALSQNFRSRKEILDSVNSVFDLLMSKEAGEVEYKGTERLEAGSTAYTEPLSSPAFNFTMLAADNGVSSSEQSILQANYVAEKIKKYIESGTRIYDKESDSFRPVTYGDIALLLRSPKNQAAAFEEALRLNGIPVYTDLDSAFFDATEIQLLLSLLRITDNPLQDISLITVLRSPLFNFDENLLATLALQRKEYLYYAVKEAAFSKENPNKKCQRFILMLDAWRKEASFTSVSDFISKLINDTHFTSYVSAMPDSEAHLSNIALFLTMARKSDDSSYKGLFNFLRYVDKMTIGENPITADSVSNSLNAVRILSIHKSKGLEFPVVFLARTETSFNNKDYTKDLLLHKELGIGINAFTEDRTKFRLPVNRAISEILINEAVSEELRVLYVALTRAREYMEVVASCSLSKNDDHFIPPEIPETITPEDVLSAGSYKDWLFMAASGNKLINLNIINNPAFANESEDENDTQLNELVPIKCTEDISDILEYTYPYDNLKGVKSKYSVSEIKHSFNPDGEIPFLIPSGPYVPSLKTPAFLNSYKVFTSAQKGSIIHYVLQHLDFNDKDISSQISKMNLTESEREAVEKEAIEKFLSSPISERLKKATEIYKEEPFTFKKNLSEITKDSSHNEEVLVQGIIDCYFLEDDHIILLDYKTDRDVTPEILRSRYEIQLSIYAEALEKRYKLPVKEKLIYSFSLNEVIHI